MDTKYDKKDKIRHSILEAAVIYSKELAGKSFLYVYGNEYFEVYFPCDCFLHLTGVETNLSAKEFYRNAKKGKLSDKQIYFTNRHPFYNAKKKLPCLKRLPELTNQVVCILKDMKTLTITYKLSLTNLDFTLGLTQNLHSSNNKHAHYYIPRTLRVKDSSLKNSKEAVIVDFIFKKESCLDKYDILVVQDKSKLIPSNIYPLILDNFYK